MHGASPEVLEDWEPAPLWWHEQQLAAHCCSCESWPEEAGDPEWVRALEAEANGEPVAQPVVEPIVWAIPGVTGRDQEPDPLPPVSLAVAALQAAVARVVAVDPTAVSALQAVVDAEAVLAVEQQLRVHSVRRVGDVGRRGLQELVGFRSLRMWLKARRPDGDSSDAKLALALQDYPLVQAAVDTQQVSLGAARRLVKALTGCWNHLDRPDRTIDGQPGDQVLPAVVSHAIGLICRQLRGLADDDPRLGVLKRPRFDAASL